MQETDASAVDNFLLISLLKENKWFLLSQLFSTLYNDYGYIHRYVLHCSLSAAELMYVGKGLHIVKF